MPPVDSELLPPRVAEEAGAGAPSAGVPASADAATRDRTLAWSLLALTSALFVFYCFQFVPRLTNYHFGDIEFTGWSGPIGARLLRGDRPYVDFVLPIPPGSFAVLAFVQWVQGKQLLLQELWLNSVLQLGMGMLAYAIAVPFTSRKNAVLVSLCSLVTTTLLWKECAYDHTAQVMSWASFAAGTRAFFADVGPRRHRLFIATGVLSALTLFFKQSTAVGVLGGFGCALVYSVAVEGFSRQRAGIRARLADGYAFLEGAVVGLLLVWLLLVALGSNLGAFVQAVFLDASALKGGIGLLLRHVANYLFFYSTYTSSLFIVTALVLVGYRLVRTRGTLHLGDEPRRESPAKKWEAIAISLVATLAFGTASALLIARPEPLPGALSDKLDRLKHIPHLGLPVLLSFLVAHLARVRDATSPIVGDARRTGHAFNACVLAALFATLLHNTSAPEFRPFYDNNPIIVFSFLSIFVALDRANLRWLQVVILSLTLAGLFGQRFSRALSATRLADPETHWAGLLVNERGLEIEKAARRVRQLTSEHETVLVLPEDVQVAALIGRPRPSLLGAIVFVDQYAARLAEHDIAQLRMAPPKVLVIHPKSPYDWQRFFRIWSADSGAERLVRFVLEDWLDEQYTLDSSYHTSFLRKEGTLDVYVRRERPREEHSSATRRQLR